MKSNQLKNPFKTDSGDIPPYLAGREEEQSLFENKLAEITGGDSPGTTVLYGPRGMGKTALLGWFKNQVKHAETKKNKIHVVWVTPDKIDSPLDLWKKLLPSPPWYKNLPLLNLKGSIKVEETTLAARLKIGESVDRKLENTLIEKNKNRRLILLMDEAHKMNPGLCNQLLNTCQTIKKEMPFMFVMAGTPGLMNLLSNVGATFVERHKYISIGRLDEKSAADAIVKPLEEQGIQITDNALSAIIKDSQCYPYFLQEWGSALWDEAKKVNSIYITDEHAAIVKPKVSIVKEHMYKGRRDKLKKLGLLSTTVAIAKAFQDTKAMTDDAVMEIIKDNLTVDSLNTQSAVERQQTFIDQDFIWQPMESNLYGPGIPSLMNYMLDQQTAQTQIKQENPSISVAIEKQSIHNNKDGTDMGY